MSNSILIACPVNKDVRILMEFLGSLERFETEGCDISYFFADDNDCKLSSDALRSFVERAHCAVFTYAACTRSLSGRWASRVHPHTQKSIRGGRKLCPNI